MNKYVYVDYFNNVRIIDRKTVLKRLQRGAILCDITEDYIVIADHASSFANDPTLSPLCN